MEYYIKMLCLKNMIIYRKQKKKQDKIIKEIEKAIDKEIEKVEKEVRIFYFLF